jgi:anhydro-N-acetylmuramic acid kinase
MRSAPLLAIGLMSGTSLDGMDAALVEVTRRSSRGRAATPGYGARLRAFTTLRYPRALHAEIAYVAHGGSVDAARIARLDGELARRAALAARAVCRRAGVAPGSVRVVGSHGQTVFHGPAAGAGRLTLQLASPARIANLTGITTVGDFRTADVTAGGEGAPLMPIVHRMLFSHPRRTRAVQNVGGIGNVTWLAPRGERCVAFDTGPGVMVIDAVTNAVTDGRLRFDRGGRIAARGRVDERLLSRLLADPYFRRKPPKSTGREHFGSSFARTLLARGRQMRLTGPDIIATATAFTAASIADQYARFLSPLGRLDEVWLAGGGARNPALSSMLVERLHPARVGPIEAIGGHGEALEAIGFALLAVAALDGVDFDLSSVTGSRRRVRLGVIAPV